MKMDVLELHLEGRALEYWQIKRKHRRKSALQQDMECLKSNYRCTLWDRQAMAIFHKEKPSYRGYKEHLNYLLEVDEAAGGISEDRS
jgi:hypothetical protein